MKSKCDTCKTKCQHPNEIVIMENGVEVIVPVIIEECKVEK
jgi:hypothetical protein